MESNQSARKPISLRKQKLSRSEVGDIEPVRVGASDSIKTGSFQEVAEAQFSSRPDGGSSERGPNWRQSLAARVEMSPASVVEAVICPDPDSGAASLEHIRRQGHLLGFRELGNDTGYLYPSFQIDFHGHRIWPEIKLANSLMRAQENPWAVLRWWVSPNPFLDGDATPISTVGVSDDQDRLVLSEAEIALLISTQFGHDTF
ncbi:hypothetical protein [Rhodococcus sp. NPDC006774]|uniref:hypothetical protein n=1 Tax=Rhodococcus sp. NPDC006774 TaxID=3157186 RepID=UPI00341005AC